MEQSSLESQSRGCAETLILTAKHAVENTGLTGIDPAISKGCLSFFDPHPTPPLTSSTRGEHTGRSAIYESPRCTQEADLVCRVCGARMEDTRLPKSVMFGELVGGRGLREGPGKSVDGVFLGRPQSVRHQRRLVDDCSPGRGGMAQDGGTRGGTCYGEMDRCKRARAGLLRAVVCPNVTGKTKERIAQSKRARAGSLAIVD